MCEVRDHAVPIPEDSDGRGFSDVITSPELLRAMFGTPGRSSVAKELSALDGHCRDFLAHTPFVVLATAGRGGGCDVSPRGGPPGFVRVLDDHRVLFADLPGNRRLDSFSNLLSNPYAALLAMVPGVGETLRVNGRACLTQDPEALAAAAVEGSRPAVAVGLLVESAYLHCAKAFRRSHLWDPEHWPDRADMAAPALMLRDHAHSPDIPVEQVQATLDDAYANRLY